MSHQQAIRVAFRGALEKFQLDAAFTVPARGVTALFGPSGCGKTTVLRCIAGLHHMADGYCAIGDDIWQDGAAFVPTHKRPIGYVFQEASLFAHLSVRRNLLYGARGLKRSPAIQRDRLRRSRRLAGPRPPAGPANAAIYPAANASASPSAALCSRNRSSC